MKDRESEEMYLETILVLKNKMPIVRSIDVANELNYAKSSISRAMTLLENKGYIIRNEDGSIILTDIGTEKANKIYERHNIITKLFVKIGADENLAEENACRIEHVITEDMFKILKAYVSKF